MQEKDPETQHEPKVKGIIREYSISILWITWRIT
jgi:hypothetical protein